MNKFIKWLLIVMGTVISACGALYLVLRAGFYYVFGASYSKTDLIDNYATNKEKILALSHYVNTIVPAGEEVDIEFKGSQTIPIFHVSINGVTSSNWGVAWSSPKADTLLQQLGWTRETLTTLKNKLDDADCTAIANGEPSTIGYQRSGTGLYSYKIFDKPLADSVKKKYNDGCTYIYYGDKVVLEYGGGAAGPQCFEGYSGAR